MLLSPIEMLLPLVMLVLIFVPLIKVIQGKTSVKSAKIRLTSHICMFFGVCLGVVLFSAYKVQAAEAAADVAATGAAAGGLSSGLGYIAAALATSLSGIGSGIAVASSASAALGAISEDGSLFGKSMIFVAMAEGIALYGLIISFMILGQL